MEKTPTKSTPKKRLNKKDHVNKIVFNLHQFLFKLKHDLGDQTDMFDRGKKYSNLNQLCASVCEVSVAQVAKVVAQSNAPNKCDSENSKSYSPKKSRKIECDSFTVSAIRRTVLGFYARKDYPTVKKVLRESLEDELFPRVGYTTFRTWMKEQCNFSYRRYGRKPVFLERSDIVAQRELYLRSAKQLRQDGYYFIYTDETWANPDITPSRGWQLLIPKDLRKNFKHFTDTKVLQDFQGNTGGFMVKGGAGRVIINHAGGSLGFIKEAEDIFISQKDSKDYHRSMNSEHYMHWFQKLVDAAPEKSVIVIDRAPYHTKKVPSTVTPKFYWKKELIVACLENRGVPLPEHVKSFNSLTKRTLIEISNKYPVEPKFLVDVIVENSGKDIKILWLPVAHCELNPIELVWAACKQRIAKRNKIGGTQYVYKLALEVIQEITPELWSSCVEHAIKVENEMWARDGLTEELLIETDNRLVINLSQYDTDSSDDDDNNMNANEEADDSSNDDDII